MEQILLDYTFVKHISDFLILIQDLFLKQNQTKVIVYYLD